MWGVFSRHVLLLGYFDDADAAERALRSWRDASVVLWLGECRVDR